MKRLSDLIKELQKALDEHGDLPVVVPDGGEHNPQEVFAEIHHAEEDEDQHGRIILCGGETFNPYKHD